METKPSLFGAITLFTSVIILVLYALLLVDFFPLSFISNTEASFYIGLILFFLLLGSTFHIAFININTALDHEMDEMTLFVFFILLILPVLFLGHDANSDITIFLYDHPIYLTEIIFWVAVTTWTIGWILRAKAIDDKKNNEITFLSFFWFFLCVFTTIGSSYYTFAIKPIERITSTIKFIDIRFIIGMLVGVFIICRGAVKAFHNGLGINDLMTLPRIQIPGMQSGFLKTFINAPILVMNILLSILVFIINLFWSIAAITFIAIGRLLLFVFKEIYYQYFRMEYVRLLLAVCIITALFIISSQVQLLIQSLQTYLEYGILLPSVIIVFGLIGLFIAILIASTLIIHGPDNFKAASKIWGENIAYKIAYLISAMWLAGWFLFGLSHIDFFRVEEFKHLGPFTIWTSIFIIGSGIIFSVIGRLKKAKGP